MPFCLVLLFDCYKGISLLCLFRDLGLRLSSIEVSRKFLRSQASRCFSSWRWDLGDPQLHSLSPYLQLGTSLAVMLAEVLQVFEGAAYTTAYVIHNRLLLRNNVTCAGFKRRLHSCTSPLLDGLVGFAPRHKHTKWKPHSTQCFGQPFVAAPPFKKHSHPSQQYIKPASNGLPIFLI